MAHYVPPSITYWKVIFFRCLEYKKVSEEENFNSPEMPLDVFSGQTRMFGREENGRGNLVPEEGVARLSLGDIAIAFAARLRASALLKSRSSSLFTRRPKPVRPPHEHQAQ
jgi:hypothetical protein